MRRIERLPLVKKTSFAQTIPQTTPSDQAESPEREARKCRMTWNGYTGKR